MYTRTCYSTLQMCVCVCERERARVMLLCTHDAVFFFLISNRLICV